MFFGDDNDPDEPFSTEDAKVAALVYCTECPVRFLCDEAGENQPFGVWGGKTAVERGYTVDLD